MNKLLVFLLFVCSSVLCGQDFSQTEEIAVRSTRKSTEGKHIVIGPRFPVFSTSGAGLSWGRKQVVYPRFRIRENLIYKSLKQSKQMQYFSNA